MNNLSTRPIRQLRVLAAEAGDESKEAFADSYHLASGARFCFHYSFVKANS
jgi:hypothetical protein